MSLPIFPTRRRWAAFAFLAAAASTGCEGENRAVPASETPGAGVIESAGTPFACGAPATPVHRLERDASLVRQRLVPMTVDVEAVVVGNFQGGLGGFFLQNTDADMDRDPATPEGVFVEHRMDASPPRVGRRLRVRGQWAASDDPARAVLALRRIESVADCGPADVPAAVELRAAPDDWAALAGMRVQIPGPLTLTGNDSLLRHGELWLAFDGRLRTATDLAAPGAASQERAAADARRLLVVDDGRGGEYPRRLWHLPDEPGAGAPYRNGSRVRGLEGIVDQRHGGWRLQLTQAVGAVEQAPRPAAPVHDPALIRVASFNVLNFFNGDGRGGGFPTERGAGSRNDLRRQRDKLVAAMRALDADVYALMEIENDGYGAEGALSELVRALSGDPALSRNGAAEAPAYAGIAPDLHRLGEDTISVGLIYRSDRVRPLGPPRHLAGGPFGDDSRVPLAQAFAAIDGGDDSAFLVVANHFKSKGCGDAEGADRDAGDGQSCYAATRSDSARRLLAWLRGAADGIGLERTLVLGDLNAYRLETPLRVLREGGLRDLLGDDPDHYSFVYQGRAGRLDHALAGAALAARVRKAGVWHVNADELPDFDYDGDARSGRRLYAADAWRSSDHDPVYVDLAP